jgi:hypothetical protein
MSDAKSIRAIHRRECVLWTRHVSTSTTALKAWNVHRTLVGSSERTVSGTVRGSRSVA